MRKHIIAILWLGCLAACNLEVENLNGPNLETLADNPTPSAIAAASTGMLITLRTGLADRPGYVSELGILGRESYVLDAADPRFITELMKTQEIGPGSLVFGGNFWATPYAGIHNAEIILTALDNVGSAMTDAEKEATRGFVKTMEALEYLYVYNTRFDVGGVIVTTQDPNVLDPLVGKADIENKIQSLLEEAKTHLMASLPPPPETGPGRFPFPLSSGFAGFDTPKTFIKVNRAIKARMSVYVGSHAQALTELQESFISQDIANPQFNLGAFNVFRSAGGDLTNQLVDPNIYANPSIFATAHKDAGGMVDDQRVLAKLEQLASPVGQSGLTATERFKMYTITTPIAIIRNEELILLKAEAEIFTNDLASANTDLNFVRTLSGGLPPYPAFASQAEAIDALVYERRNSLLFEGGHRWIDSRRLGKLGDLPLDGGFVHNNMPIPQAETDAR